MCGLMMSQGTSWRALRHSLQDHKGSVRSPALCIRMAMKRTHGLWPGTAVAAAVAAAGLEDPLQTC